MSLSDGIYMIHSNNPESGHLDLSISPLKIYPPIYYIVGSLKMNLDEQWKVTLTDNGTYKIYSTTYSEVAWIIRENTIIASELPADEFSIESAGEGVYRIHVPNKDKVATLKSIHEQTLCLEGDTGANSQRWTFAPM